MTDWAPILEGAERDETYDSIQSVLAGLADPAFGTEQLGPGVAGGNLGLALLFDEAHRVLGPVDPLLAQRDARWNSAIDGLSNSSGIQPNLFTGYCGIGWATAFLGGPGNDEVHEELELALLDDLEHFADPVDYDLINGVVGWGLYALERWPHQRAARALELIVDFLDARAERIASGVRWHTSPEILVRWQRESYPHGYFNLGLAHGIPGIVVFLAQVAERGIRTDVIPPLLEGAIDWILSNRIEHAPDLAFPSFAVEGLEPSPSRLAWCYGDLGITVSLFLAARCTGHDGWERQARALARTLAEIPVERTRVRDAGLCHGAAGVAHVFNRMFHWTGDEVLKDVSRRWFGRTLQLRVPGEGPGGYPAWGAHGPDNQFRQVWRPCAGLLEGSCGVALAQLAAISDCEPRWDRFLFISPVPVARVHS